MDNKYLLNGWCRHGVPFDACRLCAANHVESGPTSTNNARDEIAALANELEDFNSHRVAPYGRITEIVAKMRQLSPVA